MIENALIPVGGFGERLRKSGFQTQFQTKGLIEVSPGITLFEHVLSRIRDSGNVRRAVISTRKDLHAILYEIARRVDMDHIFLFDDGHTRVSNLPYHCRSALEQDPFFIIAGHAPFVPGHLQKMEKIRSHEGDEVGTLSRTTQQRQMRTSTLTEGLIKDIILDAEEGSDMRDTFAIETPFLLTPEIIKQAEDHHFSRSFGRYLSERVQGGVDLYGVRGDFPIEADYNDEMSDTLKFFSTSNPFTPAYAHYRS